MKKKALISGMVFVSCLFVCRGLFAQRFFRYGPPVEEDYYGLNLTQDQMEKIDTLELELAKELSPLIAKLRSNYVVLDELQAERNPDPARINNVWDVIYRLEEDMQHREILHENKIRDLLTEDQKALFDSYYAYGVIPFGRGGFGRGNGSDAGIGGIGWRRSAGRLGRGDIGYRRGRARGYAGQLGFGIGRFLSGIRYGKGPCGAGLCRWHR